MNRLETWWKILRALATVRDIALETRNFRFGVNSGVTVYLDIEYAELFIQYHAQPFVDVRARLQVGFGWRLHTEQDELGLYIIAKRHLIIGQLTYAQFWVHAPQDAYFILQLNQCQLHMDNLSGLYHIDPSIDKIGIARQTIHEGR